MHRPRMLAQLFSSLQASFAVDVKLWNWLKCGRLLTQTVVVHLNLTLAPRNLILLSLTQIAPVPLVRINTISGTVKRSKLLILSRKSCSCLKRICAETAWKMVIWLEPVPLCLFVGSASVAITHSYMKLKKYWVHSTKSSLLARSPNKKLWQLPLLSIAIRYLLLAMTCLHCD